jgi:hypothetical protein
MGPLAVEVPVRGGYAVDVAWPAARVALEINGPSHFVLPTGRELAAALRADAPGARNERLTLAAPGLPHVVDWSVPAERLRLATAAWARRAASPTHAERARVRVLALEGWRVVSVDHTELNFAATFSRRQFLDPDYAPARVPAARTAAAFAHLDALLVRVVLPHCARAAAANP